MSKKLLIFLLFFVFILNGCALVFQKRRNTDVTKIETLDNKVQFLEQEVDILSDTKRILEGRLSEEIKDKKVRLEMAEKGLVITLVAEVLFDSGKEELREESYPILDKVIRILNEEVPNHDIGIEGHTDNDPIKYSKWKSNWELSTQRALSVLYYLENEKVQSRRLSAIGYGEYRYVSSNDTPEGRQYNRRVEIVILPKLVKGKEINELVLTEEIHKEEEELK
ncbi:MAG: flagellar motor protein MotB [Candidatus Omnitrophica bacterium]|nr:flagellar motor protein MotB [Candidatus Omnitrophota bacterium]